jgi:hypothetical protein
MPDRALRTLLAAALVAVGLGGCGDGVSGGDCLPEPLTVQPAEVAVGAQLTLASAGFIACGARYDDGKEYQLQLAFVGRRDAIDLGDVDVARDGSFTATLTVPLDASPGESYLGVRGSPFDDPCDDGESCAGYSVAVTVLPAR